MAHGVEQDAIELAPDTHTAGPHVVTGMRTGHRYAWQRASHHADQDQSASVQLRRRARWPCGQQWHGMSEVIVNDWDRKSKIRRHCGMRNHLSYTAHAVRSGSEEMAASVSVAPKTYAEVPTPPRSTRDTGVRVCGRVPRFYF